MKRNSSIIFLFFYLLLSSSLYSEQNIKNTEKVKDMDTYTNEINEIYNEYYPGDSEKDIESEIKSLKTVKSNLQTEIKELENKNKLAFSQNNSSNTQIIENNKNIQNDIDDLYLQIVQKSNLSDNLSRRIQDEENDLNNERTEIDNLEYEHVTNEIEAENDKIIKTSEEIKRRREYSKKLKSKFVLLDEELESYKIRDGFRDKFVDTYTTYYKAEVEYKPDEVCKLVVLTQKLNVTLEKSKETGIFWKTNNILKNEFKNCLVQYYIPLDSLKPRDIKYDFKRNCLIINSPKPILDEDMLFIQVDPEQIKEESSGAMFFRPTKELKDQIMKEIKQTTLRAAKDDRLHGIAEESARYHLENYFGRFLKEIPGGNEVKLEINFY